MLPLRLRSIATRTTTLSTVACLAMAGWLAAAEEAAKVKASGYNNERLEQEDRYVVPTDQAEEVWTYLVDSYVNKKDKLVALNPNFTSFWYDEDFTDHYFDTPELKALEIQCGVRHRLRFNRTNPNDVKNGRELMQIKTTGGTGSALERGEVKFSIQHPEKFKTAEDAHPILGIVKPEHRGPFRERLAALGMDADRMKPILSIKDWHRRLYIRQDGEAFMSISLDIAHSEMMGRKATVIEVEPELNEIVFTEADAETRRYMEGISAQIVADLLQRFPALKRDLSPKYNRMFSQFEAQIPYLRLWIGTSKELLGGIALAAVVTILAGVWGIVRWRRHRVWKRGAVASKPQAAPVNA